MCNILNETTIVPGVNSDLEDLLEGVRYLGLYKVKPSIFVGVKD